MKLIITILLSLLVLSSTQAQKIYITDTTNKWYGNSFGANPKPSYTIVSSFNTSYSGRTIIQGNEYIVLKTKRRRAVEWNNAQLSADTVYSYIREDTSVGLVYGLYNIDSPEYILYDYNLSVGDSFKAFGWHDTFFVDSLVTVSINGIGHRCFHLTNYMPRPQDYWVIEGIGSTITPLGDTYYPEFWEYKRDLVCFSNKGVIPPNQYPLSLNCADSSLNVREHQPLSPKLRVYPQPASSSVTIELPSNHSVYTLRIYNLMGQRVYTDKVDHQAKILIDKHFASGIYYYKLVDGDGMLYTGQLVYN